MDRVKLSGLSSPHHVGREGADEMDTVRWVLGPCVATMMERHAAEVTVHGVEVRERPVGCVPLRFSFPLD